MTAAAPLAMWLRRARFPLADVLRQHPLIYLPLARRLRRDGPGEQINEQTQMVIEGFPRSGNTFAWMAFLQSQKQPVRIAHHLHAPAQVIAAARRGVPCLVIVRDPDEAALSLALRLPWVTLGQALRSYIRFHRSIQPHRSGFVLVRFETVTSDFGAVIHAVNRRFNTSFEPFEHTPANVRACHDAVAQHHHEHLASVDPWGEHMTARPSATRTAAKEALRSRLEGPRLSRVRGAAHQTYEKITGRADL